LANVIETATTAFEAYDYSRALEVAEQSFWEWTDDYVELVKGRAYGEGDAARSAHAALQVALGVFQRLFAPFLPFVTEEVWSWWREGSVHRQPWPSVSELDGLTGDPSVLQDATRVLAEVRRVKSEAKASMKTDLAELKVTADPAALERIRSVEADLLEATRAPAIEYAEGEFAVHAVLAPQE